MVSWGLRIRSNYFPDSKKYFRPKIRLFGIIFPGCRFCVILRFSIGPSEPHSREWRPEINFLFFFFLYSLPNFAHETSPHIFPENRASHQFYEKIPSVCWLLSVNIFCSLSPPHPKPLKKRRKYELYLFIQKKILRRQKKL